MDVHTIGQVPVLNLESGRHTAHGPALPSN